MEQTIPLGDVAATLEQWAAFAGAQVTSAPIPELLGHLSRSRQLGRMARSVRHAMRGDITVASVPVPAVVKAKRVPKVPGKPALGALAFWSLHGEAVERITVEFGSAWKVRAPFGRTETVTLATGLRSCTTDRGTKLKWPRDNRIPAARYWPGGELPAGVAVVADYERCTAEFVAVKDQHGCYSTMGAVEIPHSDAWHLSHGYVLHHAMWVSELGLRSSLAHEEAVTAEHERKAQAVVDVAAVRELAIAA